MKSALALIFLSALLLGAAVIERSRHRIRQVARDLRAASWAAVRLALSLKPLTDALDHAAASMNAFADRARWVALECELVEMGSWEHEDVRRTLHEMAMVGCSPERARALLLPGVLAAAGMRRSMDQLQRMMDTRPEEAEELKRRLLLLTEEPDLRWPRLKHGREEDHDG